MRKTSCLLLAFCLPFVLTNCEPLKAIADGAYQKVGQNLWRAPNQVILRVGANVTDKEIKEWILGFSGKEVEVESCACGDPRLRRIILVDGLEENYGDLLTVVAGAPPPPGGGMTGDYEIVFDINPRYEPWHKKLDPNSPFNQIITSTTSADKPKIADFISNNQQAGVIAILDSGIDLRAATTPFKNGKKKILFKTPNNVNCNENEGRVSGWNFVANDRFIQDYTGHGTYVTDIIVDELKETQTPFRIMPLKIANRNNKVSYWDLLCAMSYIQQVHRETGKIKVVNASFGFRHNNRKISEMLALEDIPIRVPDVIQDTLDIGKETTSGLGESVFGKDMSILREYIQEMADQNIVFVTAAGNDNKNIDHQNDRLSYYPAEFGKDNILAVGGIKKGRKKIRKHENSNYGIKSIDLGAPFNFYSQEIGNEGGTSFSTAYVSAQIFKEMLESPNKKPQEIIKDYLKPLPTSKKLKRKFKKGRYVE